MPPLRTAIALAIACLSLGLPAAHGQSAADAPRSGSPGAPITVDIESGSLDQVLNRFAAAAGVLIIADASLTAGRSSRGLRGRYSVVDGLAAILTGSGLEAVPRADGFSLRPSLAASSAAPPPGVAPGTLPPVRVVAPRETATGPANGFIATRSLTATRTDADLIDTPASVSVVTQHQIEAQATRSTSEALRYTPGVAVEFDGIDSRFDTLALRGFNAGSITWMDGIRLDGGLGGGNNWTLPQVDPYQLERIEVLKGPASVVYGQMIPGGMVHMVSKRPTPERRREIELTMGTPGQRRLALDLGGALGTQGAAWRLVALAGEHGSAVDHVKRRRGLFAPSLLLPLGDRGALTLLASIQRDRGGSDYQWLPAYGTLRPNPNGPISRSRFIGEPAFNRFDRDRDTFGWSGHYALSDSLTVHQDLRVQRLRTRLEAVTSDMFWDADPAVSEEWDWRTIRRYATRGVGESRSLGVDTHLQWKLTTGEIRHTVLAGLDFYRNHFTAQRESGLVGTDGEGLLDLYAPTYGAPVGDFSLLSRVDSVSRQTGFYLQDQISWGGWRVLAGLRRDRSQVTGSSQRAAGVDDLGERDAATTWRLGLLHRFASGFAPYTSYSTSFEPVAGVTYDGVPFRPMRGRQIEAGVKYQAPRAGWSLTAAAFDLRQTNRLTDDPVHGYPDQVQTGEVRTRGLEIEAKGRLTPTWSVTGGYTLLDTSVTRSEIPEEVGRPLLYVPRHQAAVWVDHTLGRDSPVPGMVIGAGVRHVGTSRGGDIGVDGGYGSLRIPSHTLIDARVSIQLRRWLPSFGDSELALNIANLTNKQYVNGCGSLWTCGWGLGRQVSLRLVGRF